MNTKKFIFLLSIILFLSFAFIPAKADSGFDTSYDSGGSSWSDGGSSGSDWDFDSDSDSSSSSLEVVIMFATLFISIFIMVALLTLGDKRKEKSHPKSKFAQYQDVSAEVAMSYGIENLDILKLELYQKFVDIQNAWMDFDYPTLQRLCTDELYNMYKEQLEVLKLKRNQNVMSDFKYEKIIIKNIKEENGNIIVEVYMCATFFDYIIDIDTNEVVRGNDALKVKNNYTMEFVKSKVVQNETVHCPNCNSEVHVNASGKCEYCGSTIVKNSKEFVLSKKQIDGGNNDN